MHKLILPALLLMCLVGGSFEASAGSSAMPQAEPEALSNTSLEAQAERGVFSKVAPYRQDSVGMLALQKTDEAKMFNAGDADKALGNELSIRENSKAFLSEGTQAKAGLDVGMKLEPKSFENRDVFAKADKNQSLSAATLELENKSFEKLLTTQDTMKNDM